MAENSNVQDAFVIAVEQQARERLERLSALRKIKPVDMTTLSQQVTLPTMPPPPIVSFHYPNAFWSPEISKVWLILILSLRTQILSSKILYLIPKYSI